ATVAGPRAKRSLERGWAAEAMAKLRTAARVVRFEPRSGLRFDRRQGRTHLRARLERAAKRGVQPDSRRRQERVVEGARTCRQQRSRIGSPKYTDCRRRPCLCPDGERRPLVFEGCRRYGGLAAEHPEGVQRKKHLMVAERVATGRRKQRDRNTRRLGRRTGRTRQDDGKDGVG